MCEASNNLLFWFLSFFSVFCCFWILFLIICRNLWRLVSVRSCGECIFFLWTKFNSSVESVVVTCIFNSIKLSSSSPPSSPLHVWVWWTAYVVEAHSMWMRQKRKKTDFSFLKTKLLLNRYFFLGPWLLHTPPYKRVRRFFVNSAPTHIFHRADLSSGCNKHNAPRWRHCRDVHSGAANTRWTRMKRRARAQAYANRARCQK